MTSANANAKNEVIAADKLSSYERNGQSRATVIVVGSARRSVHYRPGNTDDARHCGNNGGDQGPKLAVVVGAFFVSNVLFLLVDPFTSFNAALIVLKAKERTPANYQLAANSRQPIPSKYLRLRSDIVMAGRKTMEG
jgi:hypothetical protein